MTAAKKITKEAEAKILRSLDRVTTLVTSGSSPNDAIIKAANGGELTPHQVQLMVQAYNNARHNRQRCSADILTEKLAHFELANPAVIFAALYPDLDKETLDKQAQQVSSDYLRPPNVADTLPADFVKQASIQTKPLPRDPQRFVKKAWSLLRSLEREHEEQRRLTAAAYDKVAQAYDDLQFYFKQTTHSSFPEVRENSVALFGPEAEPIFQKLARENPRLARERANFVKLAISRDFPPYSLIETCLRQTTAHTQQQAHFYEFSKQAGAASGQLLTEFLPMPPRRYSGSILQPREKHSFDFTGPLTEGFGQGLGQLGQRGIFGALEPKAPEKLEEKALLDVMNPVADQKRQQVRAQAVFHDLMANDEFLQGEHPERVARLYNEIVRMSPRAADQPLMMRALLRRYLAQGQVDPHDVDQLAGMENKLKEQSSPLYPAQMPGSSITQGRK